MRYIKNNSDVNRKYNKGNSELQLNILFDTTHKLKDGFKIYDKDFNLVKDAGLDFQWTQELKDLMSEKEIIEYGMKVKRGFRYFMSPDGKYMIGRCLVGDEDEEKYVNYFVVDIKYLK